MPFTPANCSQSFFTHMLQAYAPTDLPRLSHFGSNPTCTAANLLRRVKPAKASSLRRILLRTKFICVLPSGASQVRAS